MIITIPDDLDLLYVEDGSRRTMSLKLGDKIFGPVSSEGAFGPLAELIMQERPETFADLAATTTTLAILHFQFMHQKCNRAGTEYPFRVPQ